MKLPASKVVTQNKDSAIHIFETIHGTSAIWLNENTDIAVVQNHA